MQFTKEIDNNKYKSITLATFQCMENAIKEGKFDGGFSLVAYLNQEGTFPYVANGGEVRLSTTSFDPKIVEPINAKLNVEHIQNLLKAIPQIKELLKKCQPK